MWSSLRVDYFVVAFVALAFMACDQCRSDEIDRIQRVWQQRQDASRSVKATWESNKVVSVSGLSKSDPNLARLVEIPPSQVTFIMQDDQSRQESTIFQVDPNDVSLSGPTQRLATFNGSEDMRLTDKAGSLKHNSGRIKDMGSPVAFQDVHLAPLLLYYRPLFPGLLGIRGMSWTLDGEQQIDGTKCLVMSRTAEGRPVSDRIYVSSDAAFLPLRYIQYVDGTRYIQADMQYSTQAGRDPDLSGWNVSLFSTADGSVVESSKAKDVSVTASNAPLDESLFRIDFPPNTQILDATSGHEQYYLTDQAGNWRPLGQQLLSERVGSETIRYVCLAVTILIVLILSIFVIRQRLVHNDV